MNSDYTQLESRILSLLKSRALAEPDFNACALEVHRFQRLYNLPYDNYCKHLGAPADLKSWKLIPAVPQSAFKQSALRAFPETATVKTFRTSGTTGEGFGSHHFCSLRLYDEAIVTGWDSICQSAFYFRLKSSRRILALPGRRIPPSPKLAGAGRGAGLFINRRTAFLPPRTSNAGLHSSSPSGEKPKSRLHSCWERRWRFLNLLKIAHCLYSLPPGSFALETGGYKGSGRSLSKAELYTLFTEHLGLAPDSVINEYGMTELSSQFYTRGLGNAHMAPPWLRALVIDPETDTEAAMGETGILRIFDLANLGSVIALQTQDLAIRREAGFELLGRDPSALPRGCSRSADEMLSRTATP